MQTLTFECEIKPDRHLVLHLPGNVVPGRHRIALVIDPPNPVPIIPHMASMPARTPLWAQLEALRQQAEAEGTLPNALSMDEILSEVQRLRGRVL
ncbi:hypothetical protein D5125_02130 [Magnetovirga frankeli]|nr:hypothetical protein D5125_02130 [gamma proteobacterium SS-5]